MNTNHSITNMSLKFKLMTLSMGITFLLGVSSYGVFRHLYNEAHEDQKVTYEASSVNLSNAIEAQFYERYGDVQAFAINPAIRSSSKSAIIDTLNVYSAMYGIYDLIMVVDAKGRLIAVNNKNPEGKELKTEELYSKNYADESWFKATLAGQTTDDKDKGFSGTLVEDIQIDPYVSKVFGANRLGNSFSAPIKNEAGAVIGVITNRAGSRWFEGAFRESLENLKKTGDNHAVLSFYNRDGSLFFEYSSNPNSEKMDDVKYDWNRLFKVNFTDKYESVKAVAKLKSGGLIEKDFDTKQNVYTGFSQLEGPKFIDKLGWSTTIRDSESESMQVYNRAQNLFYMIFGVVMLISCLVSYFFSVSLSKKLSVLAEHLSHESDEVLSASKSISQSSTLLSEAATEQASAIQETAASIDEVSSMVKKSAENATQSQKVSQSSREVAEQGQHAIQDMIQSIGDISQSNASIMTQVEDGNRQISDIVKVIAEIGNKTKVINDIVFQTKLLSFNASVEAARAGEHGKGFAVVAEEVGNLAQMSGSAAKEISSMLESSIQKVEGIVNDTRTRVEKLMVESKLKVEKGTQVAQRCGESLGNILNTVQEVDTMVSEISAASTEQAQGVVEINSAMNQLDQVTQKNTAVAQSAATAAGQLNGQAMQLNKLVSELFSVIGGSDKAKTQSYNEPSNHSQSKPKSKGQMKGTSSAASNVVRMQPKKTKAVEVDHEPMPLKLAAGAENVTSSGSTTSNIPSKDDPRFEDI